jgi:hypothetical protein
MWIAIMIVCAWEGGAPACNALQGPDVFTSSDQCQVVTEEAKALTELWLRAEGIAGVTLDYRCTHVQRAA